MNPKEADQMNLIIYEGHYGDSEPTLPSAMFENAYDLLQYVARKLEVFPNAYRAEAFHIGSGRLVFTAHKDDPEDYTGLIDRMYRR